jgi:hypothetical protein
MFRRASVEVQAFLLESASAGLLRQRDPLKTVAVAQLSVCQVAPAKNVSHASFEILIGIPEMRTRHFSQTQVKTTGSMRRHHNCASKRNLRKRYVSNMPKPRARET